MCGVDLESADDEYFSGMALVNLSDTTRRFFEVSTASYHDQSDFLYNIICPTLRLVALRTGIRYNARLQRRISSQAPKANHARLFAVCVAASNLPLYTVVVK
jgi:hypothetical protein